MQSLNRQEVKLGEVITALALYRSHVASQLLFDKICSSAASRDQAPLIHEAYPSS
jgi:hypothetical protein